MRKLIFLLSMCFALTVQSADIHITPDSSLVDAVRKAREMRRLGKATEVTIHLAAGTYYLYEPLRLRPEDSGLTIVGNGAVISGGMPVNSWKKQGKLLVADVPDFNGCPVDFRQLWVNGKKAVRARDVMDFEQMHRIMTYDKKNHVLWIPRKAVEKLKAYFSPLTSHLSPLEMVLHEMWCTSNLRIKSMSPQGDSVAVRFHNPEGPIQFQHPWPSPMTPDTKHPSPFYLTNAKELLDEPGEWYYDPQTSDLSPPCHRPCAGDAGRVHRYCRASCAPHQHQGRHVQPHHMDASFRERSRSLAGWHVSHRSLQAASAD